MASEDLELIVSKLVADMEATVSTLAHYRRQCAILRVEPDLTMVRLHERLMFALKAYHDTDKD